MKHLIFTLGAVCIAACAMTAPPLLADAPQAVTLGITLKNSTVSLGEPITLVCTLTNSEDADIAGNVNHDPRRWLRIEVDDASGQPVPTVSDPTPLLRHAGCVVPTDSAQTGTVLLTHWEQITQAGHYTVNIRVHAVFAWVTPGGGASALDRTYSLPLTVTPEDPTRLHAVAEGLRQAVLQDKNTDDARLAAEALFSMRDAASVAVWHELAADPQLDPFRAADVMSELAKVNSVDASDTLALMAPVAPDRWSRTGQSPVAALEGMREAASPGLKSHINALLANLGVPPGSRPLGSADGIAEYR